MEPLQRKKEKEPASLDKGLLIALSRAEHTANLLVDLNNRYTTLIKTYGWKWYLDLEGTCKITYIESEIQTMIKKGVKS